MGITWKIIMVLLSTLAALVIIVHSAEEYENQYRRGLRPRAMDKPLSSGNRRYEQPWRTLEVEPIMEKSTSRVDIEDTSSEEPPRRRRPGRKRKRRPEPTSTEEEIDSHERFTYSEDALRPHLDDLSTERQTSDNSKRRRKKIERRFKWTDSLEEDRPTRRRGYRRKRPSAETWPVFSEFNDFRPNEAPRDVDEVSTDQIMTMNEDEHGDSFGSTQHLTKKQLEDIIETREVEFGIYDRLGNKKREKYPNDFKINDEIYLGTEKEDSYRIKTAEKEEKSLSEFSIEDLTPTIEHNTNEGKRYIKEKLRDKSSGHFKEIDKAQVNDPIDPLTLKDILKRSNGTSLSEILQQHNLTLADLLRGKEMALSILKSENVVKYQQSSAPKIIDAFENKPVEVNLEETETNEEKLLQKSETKYVTEPITEITTTTSLSQNEEQDVTTVEDLTTTTTEKPIVEEPKKRTTIRFPTANRRKQRIRPVLNNNYKSQVNRDMLALTARKYFYNNTRRRNTTKSQMWKDVLPLTIKNQTVQNDNEKVEVETTTTIADVTTLYEENTTTAYVIQKDNPTIIYETEQAVETLEKEDSRNKTQTNKTQIAETDAMPMPVKAELDQPSTSSTPTTPTTQVNTSGLRRQAFNNILKKKRRKQKYSSTTEPPQDDFMKNLYGMPNLVSSSEFIERTQGPKTSLDDVTILEDFITTEMPKILENKTVNLENKPKKSRYSSTRSPSTYIHRQTFIPSSTEESAKIEIEEILNDTRANVRLSKILMERNMTLSELVEHRERGSSHVHLADIFHNASKEPNPDPEPFLSKSAIEPISKETYPLRALLDANIHDTTTKSTTIEPSAVQDEYIHIPMKMDFGNNVNENAESMGIMSLFKNITSTDSEADASTLMKDSEGSPYSTSIVIVNATEVQNETKAVREGRVMHSRNENPDDIVGWNEIFSIMRRNYENRTKELAGLIPADSTGKPSLEEDLDGDGLIVLEDLQRLNELSSKIALNENLDNINEIPQETETLSSNLDKGPSQTKSVTLATASVVGLAMVLFLLIFIGYRWRQQRDLVDTKHFPDERIPTPVFENRKGHKNNSSTRSISPMLSSNIYTLSTMDSQNGKDSPDYMWDSLRKPFQ